MISILLLSLAIIIIVIGIIDELIVGMRSRNLLHFVLRDLPHKPPENKDQVTELFEAISTLGSPLAQASKRLQNLVRVSESRAYLIASPACHFPKSLLLETGRLPSPLRSSAIGLALGIAASSVQYNADQNISSALTILVFVGIGAALLKALNSWTCAVSKQAMELLLAWMDDVLVASGSASIARLQRDNNRALGKLMKRLDQVHLLLSRAHRSRLPQGRICDG